MFKVIHILIIIQVLIHLYQTHLCVTFNPIFIDTLSLSLHIFPIRLLTYLFIHLFHLPIYLFV